MIYMDFITPSQSRSYYFNTGRLWLFRLPVALCLSSIILSPDIKASQCPCDELPTILGIIETAKLVNINGLETDALIDTGATTTAMDAKNIRMHINRKGQRWVYYDFVHKKTGRTVAMHQPVARVARIITHSGPPKERPVVMNTIDINGILKFVEVSLINRSSFPQQLLIGRNFLKGTALVDSDK